MPDEYILQVHAQDGETAQVVMPEDPRGKDIDDIIKEYLCRDSFDGLLAEGQTIEENVPVLERVRDDLAYPDWIFYTDNGRPLEGIVDNEDLQEISGDVYDFELLDVRYGKQIEVLKPVPEKQITLIDRKRLLQAYSITSSNYDDNELMKVTGRTIDVLKNGPYDVDFAIEVIDNLGKVASGRDNLEYIGEQVNYIFEGLNKVYRENNEKHSLLEIYQLIRDVKKSSSNKNIEGITDSLCVLLGIDPKNRDEEYEEKPIEVKDKKKYSISGFLKEVPGLLKATAISFAIGVPIFAIERDLVKIFWDNPSLLSMHLAGGGGLYAGFTGRKFGSLVFLGASILPDITLLSPASYDFRSAVTMVAYKTAVYGVTWLAGYVSKKNYRLQRFSKIKNY